MLRCGASARQPARRVVRGQPGPAVPDRRTGSGLPAGRALALALQGRVEGTLALQVQGALAVQEVEVALALEEVQVGFAVQEIEVALEEVEVALQEVALELEEVEVACAVQALIGARDARCGLDATGLVTNFLFRTFCLI